jgi:hypothetical protein
MEKIVNNLPEHYHKMYSSVLKTMKANKVMVSSFPDGIYIRMAGDKDKGEAFSETWAKVLPFTETENI